MSTIKVDTLQTRAGSTAAVTGAGFVATDQIKGNTTATSVTMPTTTKIGATAIVSASAGSATIIAEGGTNTTNIQQGLAKVWVQFNGSGTVALVDSFNIGSLTDRGTGDYDLAFTNDMAGNTWAAGMNGSLNRSAGVTHCVITGADSAAGILNARCDRNNGTAADFTHVEAVICGDLA